MNTPSKLHPKFQAGVVIISALWGLGKSMLAFTAERPGQTAVIDFDLKGEQMARDYTSACASNSPSSGVRSGGLS